MKSASVVLVRMVVLLVLAPLASATTWYTDGVSGNDSNDCLSETTACKTIGHAISLAASGDSIMVAAAAYTENLTINISLNVVGAGAATTIIDGGGVGTAIMVKATGAHITLSRFTIRNGSALQGGGIYSDALLMLTNVVVTGNHSRVFGGFGTYGKGAGIYNSGTMQINKSTVSENYAQSGNCYCTPQGGGIYNQGILTINNTLVNGNAAGGENKSGYGGGIYNEAMLIINNSTITGNHADYSAGGIFGSAIVSSSTIEGNSAGSAGGIGGSFSLQNSVVANSASGGNCAGTITSNGYNLSSDSTCNFAGPGDLNNTNPMLGALQSNGGPTQTMALLPGSPAIDAGNPSGCTDGAGHVLKTDQRGFPRHDAEDTAGCDIGAYERQSD